MSKRQKLTQLQQGGPHILPSLLMCDFGDLRGEVARLEQAGVQGLHLDVMDGNFVPNLTYGMPIVASLRKLTELTLDVHLMIDRPERYLDAFIQAGADVITFHVEAAEEPRSALRSLRDAGVSAGLAINPGTAMDQVLPYVDECDLVLVMSVNAGFGGQTFQRIALDRLAALRRARPELVLEVDGGVNAATIRSCAEAGADLLVVGSAIFQQSDYEAAVWQLESLIV